MSSDPPPPYPGGPSAPFLGEKNGQPPVPAASAPVMTGPPQGQPLPPEYGPPPYEATLQPGFVPPHVPGEGPMPKPVHMPMPMPHPHGGYYAPPGHFPHPIAEHCGPGPSHFAPGHTATVLALLGATTPTVDCSTGRRCSLQCRRFVHTASNPSPPASATTSASRILLSVCSASWSGNCDLGCCLIPCFIDDLKDVTHTCPNCKGYIYTYKRIC
ncbi:hypothetical protein cypCar_00004453 [Cyprinus carpio]|nr:hypothetical protein cypCar_00004453 [Cyprinus carpio]